MTPLHLHHQALVKHRSQGLGEGEEDCSQSRWKRAGTSTGRFSKEFEEMLRSHVFTALPSYLTMALLEGAGALSGGGRVLS